MLPCPRNLEAFKRILENEVHDAGNGVRTVNRRITTGRDVDPLDQIGREGVDVGRDGVVQNVCTDMAATVDQIPACADVPRP